MDAEVATDERSLSVRQRRVVLTSRCWRQCTWRQSLPGRNGGKRAVLRGELAISRKAIAQGMSECLRCPVCSCAHFLVHIAHETAGAARIPAFPAPSEFRGRKVSSNPRAFRAARSRTHIQLSSPGLTGRPSIPETSMIEPRSRGVLDPPHARGTTACVKSRTLPRPRRPPSSIAAICAAALNAAHRFSVVSLSIGIDGAFGRSSICASSRTPFLVILQAFPRHCEERSDEAIHLAAQKKNGLLRRKGSSQ